MCGAVSSKWAKGTGGPAGDECYNLVTHSLRADGFDASEVVGPLVSGHTPHGHGCAGVNSQAVEAGHIIPILEAGARTGKSTDDIRAGIGIGEEGDPMFTLQSVKQHAVAFNHKASAHQSMNPGEVSPTLEVGKSDGVCVAIGGRARGDDGRGYDRPEHFSIEVAGTVDGVKPERVLGPNSMAVRRLTPRECERLQGLPDDYTLVHYNGKPAADGPRYKAIGNGMAMPVLRWIGERIKAVMDSECY